MWYTLANWRFLMVLVAIAIVGFCIYFTNKMAQNIAMQERASVEVFAIAQESIADIENADNKLAFTIIQNNVNIPVIITDSLGKILDSKNLEDADMKRIDKVLTRFRLLHEPIVSGPQKIYFGESKLLENLKYFPYLLMAIISVFLSVVYIAYHTANKSIQNRVWVGLSKETAHQLGTPLMSLVGWLEYLKLNGQTQGVEEMEKDVNRLQLVADRFSKIGSVPQLKEENIIESLQNIVEYMRKRVPKNVQIIFDSNDKEYMPCMLNAPLFEWVIENLIRNSLDAMQGQGEIILKVRSTPSEITIDLSDTGKGISKQQHKKIFKPGFSTKQRGWGLGLSLAKRIVSKYHRGSIEVLKSELNVGTTFRIVLHTAS